MVKTGLLQWVFFSSLWLQWFLFRQILLWTPEFVLDFLLNSEITNEKISVGMIAFGVFMIALGFRKNYDQTR